MPNNLKNIESFQEYLDCPETKEESRIKSKIGIMAYHGGKKNELFTKTIACEICKKTNASYYAVTSTIKCHITSTEIEPSDSQKLSEFIHHVITAISIHGHNKEQFKDTIFIGGLNSNLREELSLHLKSEERLKYKLISKLDEIPVELRGNRSNNIVNRPPQQGVQLELPRKLRLKINANDRSIFIECLSEFINNKIKYL